MLDRLGVLLALLVLAGIPAFAQDPNEINSRFENMRAYSRFGNDYVNVHPNDLFLAVPFGGTGDRVPGKASSKFEKGNQFLLKDQFDKAKQQYEAALADYPDYASARLNLGVAELNLKDAGHARQEFQTACRLNPQLSLAFQNLARVYRPHRVEADSRLH